MTQKFRIGETVNVKGVTFTVVEFKATRRHGYPYKLSDGFYYPEDELSSAATLNSEEYEITNGYVGSYGVRFETASPATFAEATAKAALRHGVTVVEIERRLLAGESVVWCDSPNYAYDHVCGVIRRKRQPKPQPALVRCNCGHSVPASQVMNASMGTACPDCYDRMSD